MNTYTEKEIERLLKNGTIDDITYKSTKRLYSVILDFHLAIEANIIESNKKKTHWPTSSTCAASRNKNGCLEKCRKSCFCRRRNRKEKAF